MENNENYTQEELEVAAAAVREYRQEQQRKAEAEAEAAALAEFRTEIRDIAIRGRFSGPKNDTEKALWRKYHGAAYRGPQDLKD